MGHARAMTSDIKLKQKTYLLLPFFVLSQFINGLIFNIAK